jgi:CheY-like chemotaxis protein
VTTESPHNARRKSDSKGYNKPRFWKMNRKVHSASDLNAALSSPSSPSHSTTAGGEEEGDSLNESEVKYARNRGSESKILKTALSLGSTPSREISRREDVKEDKPLSALRISLSSADGNCPSPSSSSRLLTPNTMTTLIPHQHSIISHEEDGGFPSPISAHLPRTILIVDDSTVIQKATKRSLVRAGYEVEVADNGLNGLNLMKEKVYTAVLMDIEMPVMGGLEATKKIREYEEEYFWNRPSNRPRQKIIGVTASTDSSIREKALAVGMDEFLHKPFQLESIQMLFSRLSV